MRRVVLPVTFGLLVAIPALSTLIFFIRSPVLVVTNASFAALYGTGRVRRQQVSASLSLYRLVKPVQVADDAGSDILVIAITKAAVKPYCVVFPYIFTDAAGRYHEEFPEIPVVVLNGRAEASDLPSENGILRVFCTDRGTDMYRAGLFAGIISETSRKTAQKPLQEDSDRGETAENRMNVVLFQDLLLKDDEKELFSRGVREEYPESGILLVRTITEMPDPGRVSCAVFAGAGVEYIERNPRIPLVLFTWLDPALVSGEVAVIFDDSPWALTVPAVRMVAGNQAEGKIPSKPLIFSAKFADNGVFRRLKKSAKKNCE